VATEWGYCPCIILPLHLRIVSYISSSITLCYLYYPLFTFVTELCVFGNVGAFSLSLVIIWVLLCFPHVGLRKHVGSSRKVSHWHKSSSCLEWRWGMVCEKMKIKLEIQNFKIYIFSICFTFVFLYLISWMFRYDATIEAYSPNGYFVSYDGWGNKEEVWFL